MLYCIAEHRVRVNFCEGGYDRQLLSSFTPFEVNEDGGDVLLHIEVDDTLKPIPKSERRLMREVDTGNGLTKVFRCEHHSCDSDGNDVVEPFGYQFIIKDLNGRDCALLIADETFHVCRCALNGSLPMRSYGLNSCIMMSYAFSTASFDTVLIHASLVRCNGKGYAFTAKSGTGKSTQVSNWLRYIPGCDLMNDDNPIIRVVDGVTYIYGSPWSGKTPCYRNVKAELGGLAMIKRADENRLERLSPITAYVTVLPACSTMKWDSRVYSANNDTVLKLIEMVPVYNLFCLPDRESAEVAWGGMCK